MKPSLLLLSGLFLSPVAFAADNSKVHISYNLTRQGGSICEDAKIVTADQEVVICEGTNTKNNKKVVVKARIQMIRDGEFETKAVIEEIDTDNIVKVVGAPGIFTVGGQKAEISQGTDEVEEYKLSVSVNNVF